MTKPLLAEVDKQLGRFRRISLLAMLGLVGSSIAVLALTELSGAVIAPGTLVVENNLKKVQHQTGGTVAVLKVQEGQVVEAGALLMRLDDTAAKANLAIVVNELSAHQARRARLVTERERANEIVFPAALIERAANDTDIDAMLRGERALFESRRKGKDSQRAQLMERREQFTDEERGLDVQYNSLAKQLEIAKSELSDVEQLYTKNLVPRTRVSQLQREVVRIEGAMGEILTKKPQTKGRRTEIQLQIATLDADFLSEVSKELRESETKINELLERRIAAEDQVSKVDIRAPIGGQVHQLQVHTVGGVVTPAEPMMLVVPSADKLLVEVRVSPIDIEEIKVGQQTRVRFSGLPAATTPEVMGIVTRVAGDISRDDKLGISYYLVAVQILPEEIARITEFRLIPGMPVDSYFLTKNRTIGNFLLKPFFDHMNKALRES